MLPGTTLLRRWVSGSGSQESAGATHVAARQRAIRLAAGGSLLITGFALGAALYALVDDLESDALPAAAIELADGCTTLALDRSNGRTEAEPCRDTPEVTATLQASLIVRAAY